MSGPPLAVNGPQDPRRWGVRGRLGPSLKDEILIPFDFPKLKALDLVAAQINSGVVWGSFQGGFRGVPGLLGIPLGLISGKPQYCGH